MKSKAHHTFNTGNRQRNRFEKVQDTLQRGLKEAGEDAQKYANQKNHACGLNTFLHGE